MVELVGPWVTLLFFAPFVEVTRSTSWICWFICQFAYPFVNASVCLPKSGTTFLIHLLLTSGSPECFFSYLHPQKKWFTQPSKQQLTKSNKGNPPRGAITYPNIIFKSTFVWDLLVVPRGQDFESSSVLLLFATQKISLCFSRCLRIVKNPEPSKVASFWGPGPLRHTGF